MRRNTAWRPILPYRLYSTPTSDSQKILRRPSMQPIRQIVHDAPEFIAVPPEFQHRPIELIIWPLEEAMPVTEPGEPQFLIAEVDHIVIESRPGLYQLQPPGHPLVGTLSIQATLTMLAVREQARSYPPPPYPSGFIRCQRQVSAHIRSRPNSAFQPSNRSARAGSAQQAAISPGRRATIS